MRANWNNASRVEGEPEIETSWHDYTKTETQAKLYPRLLLDVFALLASGRKTPPRVA